MKACHLVRTRNSSNNHGGAAAKSTRKGNGIFKFKAKKIFFPKQFLIDIIKNRDKNIVFFQFWICFTLSFD